MVDAMDFPVADSENDRPTDVLGDLEALPGCEVWRLSLPKSGEPLWLVIGRWIACADGRPGSQGLGLSGRTSFERRSF